MVGFDSVVYFRWFCLLLRLVCDVCFIVFLDWGLLFVVWLVLIVAFGWICLCDLSFACFLRFWCSYCWLLLVLKWCCYGVCLCLLFGLLFVGWVNLFVVDC